VRGVLFQKFPVSKEFLLQTVMPMTYLFSLVPYIARTMTLDGYTKRGNSELPLMVGKYTAPVILAGMPGIRFSIASAQPKSYSSRIPGMPNERLRPRNQILSLHFRHQYRNLPDAQLVSSARAEHLS
jgi:hypothetical protein